MGLGLVVAALLGSSGQSEPASGRAETSREEGAIAPRRYVTWIISDSDLERLREDNAGLARRFFDNRNTFVVGSRSGENPVPRGYRSIPALGYASLRAFERDLERGAVNPQIAAVLYDPESWTATPAAERRNPGAAMRRFTRLSASWGLGSIVAPGRDLALGAEAGCGKRAGELLDRAYLRCGLPRAGSSAEQFVIQSAPEELVVARLRGLLTATRRQLRAAPERPLLLTSLSTEPPGADEQLWPADLLRAARVELGYADGVMFNFTPGTTDLAASFLRDLEPRRVVNGFLVSHRD